MSAARARRARRRTSKVAIGDAESSTAPTCASHAGELVAVVGPNGAGKSTLVARRRGPAADGAAATSAGAARRSASCAAARSRACARSCRSARPCPPASRCARRCGLGRSPHVKPARTPDPHDHEAVDRALARTGVIEFAERRLTTLSGGELQRVQIAVGLAQEAPVLIADEPTSHLDLGATAGVARLLRGLADDGLVGDPRRPRPRARRGGRRHASS